MPEIRGSPVEVKVVYLIILQGFSTIPGGYCRKISSNSFEENAPRLSQRTVSTCGRPCGEAHHRPVSWDEFSDGKCPGGSNVGKDGILS